VPQKAARCEAPSETYPEEHLFSNPNGRQWLPSSRNKGIAMSSANNRMAEGSTPAKSADDYVAPTLTLLGQVRDLTESHHHHHHHRHPWDGPNGLHPPGLPLPLFNGSA
jgi:hypothetical protein